MKLYEITDDLIQIDVLLEESGGDLTPEIEARLEALREEFPRKVENILKLRVEMRAQADAANDEAKRLLAIAESRGNASRRLLEYIERNMRKLGAKRVNTDLFRLAICKNGSVSIRPKDPACIPDDFKRIPPAEFDYRKALEFLKDSGKLPADPGMVEIEGLVVERGEHLRVQ